MKVQTAPIILASSSPRRKELLQLVGIPFQVHASHVDEEVDQNLSPEEIVEELAQRKAEDVSLSYNHELIIGSDTIVVLDQRILGKPKDSQEAFFMLKELQGRAHWVYSGVAVVDSYTRKVMVSHQKTKVWMRSLSDEEIQAYIATKEPLDKAGSYGIQGIGAILIERIEGDYFNIVGLPLVLLQHMLQNFNISILKEFHTQKLM
ncbi:Maf family protein [Tepidibacillus marianensis]|uniref:Maf family protein n=1 Tax=Tepidibacillus marianensis TaxID=3131995 RepID=UPI0030CC03CB